MKILLVYPRNIDAYSGHSPYPPLGLLYIAAYAREKGFKDIKILDCVVDPVSGDTLHDEIAEADIIGVGGFTSQFKHAIEISKICKQLKKLSICGGVHVNSMPALSLEMSSFDIAVKGEGEIAFYEIIKHYDSGNSDFSKINGILYWRDSKILENNNRAYVDDLNQLPFPARDLVDMNKYRAKDEYFSSFFTHILSSRGCPFECTFCNSPKTWGRRIRFRSADSIVSEISELYHNYGVKCIHISDDGFTYRRNLVLETCNLLRENNIKIEWACVSRPELVDEEALRIMKAAGCIRISIGVENADLNILERAKKKYSLKKIEEAVALIKKAGILVHCYMMIGLPGENIMTFWKSMKFMRKLKPDRIGWAVVVPYPGTEIYDKSLVDIVDHNYLEWGGYLRPVIKVGYLSPKLLRILQLSANFITQKKYQDRNAFVAVMSALLFYLPGYILSRVWFRVKQIVLIKGER